MHFCNMYIIPSLQSQKKLRHLSQNWSCYERLFQDVILFQDHVNYCIGNESGEQENCWLNPKSQISTNPPTYRQNVRTETWACLEVWREWRMYYPVITAANIRGHSYRLYIDWTRTTVWDATFTRVRMSRDRVTITNTLVSQPWWPRQRILWTTLSIS